MYRDIAKLVSNILKWSSLWHTLPDYVYSLTTPGEGAVGLRRIHRKFFDQVKCYCNVLIEAPGGSLLKNNK